MFQLSQFTEARQGTAMRAKAIRSMQTPEFQILDHLDDNLTKMEVVQMSLWR